MCSAEDEWLRLSRALQEQIQDCTLAHGCALAHAALKAQFQT